eukprot:Amastigsp_a515158_12.p2 type:complete len:296 gc:universal Amastigsp_a515158_12:1103-216(-)
MRQRLVLDVADSARHREPPHARVVVRRLVDRPAGGFYPLTLCGQRRDVVVRQRDGFSRERDHGARIADICNDDMKVCDDSNDGRRAWRLLPVACYMENVLVQADDGAMERALDVLGRVRRVRHKDTKPTRDLDGTELRDLGAAVPVVDCEEMRMRADLSIFCCHACGALCPREDGLGGVVVRVELGDRSGEVEIRAAEPFVVAPARPRRRCGCRHIILRGVVDIEDDVVRVLLTTTPPLHVRQHPAELCVRATLGVLLRERAPEIRPIRSRRYRRVLRAPAAMGATRAPGEGARA